jgi:hypothetical protein
MQFHNESGKGTESVHNILRKFRKNIGQTSGKKAWAVYGKSKLIETENDETDEQQTEEHAHNFVRYQGDWLSTRNSYWQAKL